MSKHTPGPWRLHPWYDLRGNTKPTRWSGIFEPIPGQELGSQSCVLTVGVKGDVEDLWLSMSEANARLIAAAPDTHEALKATAASLAAAISLLERAGKTAKRAAPSDTMFDMMISDYRKALDEARAAIAKATGGDT